MERIDDPPSVIAANCRLKVPRIVASSPNYTRQRANQISSKSSSTKISKSDKSNACSELARDEISKRKLNRAWGTADLTISQRKRISKVSKTANKSVKVSKVYFFSPPLNIRIELMIFFTKNFHQIFNLISMIR